ncbi:oligoribonuclease [Buchnera aphidicola str. Bp (Baizongia pistaciae)]|uniref:Oligoribonuclease n=1 Tax=Buchnera aphidicola subsp. Baizongia pistaciae (strain Bp) TaxID=224915 RepID=ORN_BUCBP|nr:RecName: Full=Oligoribonuclease [Buchnera aphidicola str. Bp (Baizongia pistaciae)]AAO27222.1 oligoribonuclease [Buchnera aphidicola str. Bp (Baizongia pistaciae)]
MNTDIKNLIWIDLEMTGLNPNIHKIIEIATLITDKNLKILSYGPVIAIYQNNHQLSFMDPWNNKMHTKNGLITRIKNSLYTEHLAEIKTITFLKKWVPKNTSPMCGNSISTDRQFLFKYMPTLEKYFHYRQIDVSTIKELALRWKPKIYNKLKKKTLIKH